ncbi:SCF E3 ubiquitin ligase complex F-box protein grrA [Grifola frondosa]|uniref:SCF E3 ubiquitin ligase complex F-box protein grrA n=1 Tax=Grifola frondosa TaxID=5627 RepID=A0A1C7MJD7_GRIFR|nr:SCF E3 ubiquitin ligase complex F-box protein grrA [Grifola frondosa]
MLCRAPLVPAEFLQTTHLRQDDVCALREDQTFLYAHFIRRLNFLCLGSELSDSLFARLAHCVRLERLTLINCKSISDEGLMRVLPNCPSLVALDLTGVSEVTDNSIVALAASTKRLQGINLTGCRQVTDKGVLALAANCSLLRRVKLSNVDEITDESICALADACPLLLEIDLNNCKNITDAAVRELWTHSTQMREMRLSHCGELTDAAFPAPPRRDVVIPPGPNPFPSYNNFIQDQFPPLRLTHTFDHLRMLDLTACSALTDEAIEGIISVAPKIRNLVLAKCSQLTDVAVESICKLGRHLHYLHLGHAGSITDRSINSLVRSCTRLRYIDLANCLQLTDMSVFELSTLQKLRRIGLVRVNNLTDQAIQALSERQATLERIHLSYCDQISVMAIHFLLQKLPKLTHLSLTGIPSFRRQELQQFCRSPPPDFNSSQRAAFCVYSGKGVAELRDFLAELFTTITEDLAASNDTDYDEDFDEGYQSRQPDDFDRMDEGDDGDDDDDEATGAFGSQPNIVITHGSYRHTARTPHTVDLYSEPETYRSSYPPVVATELMMTRDRGNHPTPRSSVANTSSWLSGHSAATASAGPSRGVRGFGQQPIVETSTSPAPSDVASNRSTGTNQSSGTAFFRSYTDSNVLPRHGVMTPDLVFAEIGHGRGAGPGPSTVLMQNYGRRMGDGAPGTSYGGLSAYPSTNPSGPSSFGIAAPDVPYSVAHPFRVREFDAGHDRINDRGAILLDTSNSYQRNVGHPEMSGGWAAVHEESSSRSMSSSPTTRELHDSVQSALGTPMLVDSDPRERSVKRSIRNTLTAAESFLFGGRGASGSTQEGVAGLTNSRDVDMHGH